MTDRELADDIWLNMKWYKVPTHWDDEQVLEIIIGYWHRAMSKGEG